MYAKNRQWLLIEVCGETYSINDLKKKSQPNKQNGVPNEQLILYQKVLQKNEHQEWESNL